MDWIRGWVLYTTLFSSFFLSSFSFSYERPSPRPERRGESGISPIREEQDVVHYVNFTLEKAKAHGGLEETFRGWGFTSK